MARAAARARRSTRAPRACRRRSPASCRRRAPRRPTTGTDSRARRSRSRRCCATTSSNQRCAASASPERRRAPRACASAARSSGRRRRASRARAAPRSRRRSTPDRPCRQARAVSVTSTAHGAVLAIGVIATMRAMKPRMAHRPLQRLHAAHRRADDGVQRDRCRDARSAADAAPATMSRSTKRGKRMPGCAALFEGEVDRPLPIGSAAIDEPARRVERLARRRSGSRAGGACRSARRRRGSRSSGRRSACRA